MRKIGAGIFCVTLCLAVAFIVPQMGKSYADVGELFKWELFYFGAHSDDGAVDDSNCLASCHNADLGAGLHITHTACDTCHVGGYAKGTVSASSCSTCHPSEGTMGECPIVNLHDPAKATCMTASCHTTCGPVDTTTTTTTDDETTTTTTIKIETTTTTSTDVSTTTSSTEECCLLNIYGEDSEEVEVLRYLRDSVLSKTPAGREIIRLYYQLSPVISIAVQSDEEVKEEVKEMVDGILLLITADAVDRSERK